MKNARKKRTSSAGMKVGLALVQQSRPANARMTTRDPFANNEASSTFEPRKARATKSPKSLGALRAAHKQVKAPLSRLPGVVYLQAEDLNLSKGR